MIEATIKAESVLAEGSSDHYTKISFKLQASNNLKSYRVNDGAETSLSASVWGDANNITRSNSATVAGKNTFYVTDILGETSSTDFYMANKDGVSPNFKNGKSEVELVGSDNFGALTNTLTIEVPENAKKDDLLILTYSCGNARDGVIIPDGWNTLFETNGGVTYYGDIRLYYKFVTDNEPLSYDFAQQGIVNNGSSGVLVCLRNVDLEIPFSTYDYLNQTDVSVLTATAPKLNYKDKTAFQLRGFAVRNQISEWDIPKEEIEIERYSGFSGGNILVLGRKQELGTDLTVGFNNAYRTSAYSAAINANNKSPAPEPAGKGKMVFEQNLLKRVLMEGKDYIRMLLDGEVVWSKGGSAPYSSKVLISSGKQYINTLVKGNSNLTVELKIRGVGNSGTVGIFGTRFSNSTSSFVLWFLGSQFRFDYATETNNTSNAGLDTIEPFVVKKEGRFNYIEGVLVQTNVSASFTNSIDLTLFTVNSGGNVDPRMSSLELYYCKIWNNDVLVRDYIPVETGDIIDELTAPSNCLYDKVSKTFFENQGTGEFGIAEV